MKLVRSALWSANAVLHHQFRSPLSRTFSASSAHVSDDWNGFNASESSGDYGQSNFGQSKMASFYQKLDKAEKRAHDSYGIAGLGESYNSLVDGMDYKLKKAATYFEFDPVEVVNEDYTYRPDVNFGSGMTYDTKDLDLRKPGVRKPNKRLEFETTTEEVLREADFRKLDKAEKRAHDSYGIAGLGESYNSLVGGMDYKLKKAATYFEFDPVEVVNEDYTYRPDVNFGSGMTYDTKDLDLRKPGVRKPNKRLEFETTTEEVLREADFRNVKFLANFITEAGIIIKRSKTRISAKAQRKVAREIKTARAFGLMPFTSMGTKQFRYGDTMENKDHDFSYETSYDHNFVEEGVEADA